MNPDAQKILTAEVVRVENFQEMVIQTGPFEDQQWTADFHLKNGQGFHVLSDAAGYSYTPVSGMNNLPELRQIFWKRYKMGFGGRGCGLYTEVQLIDGAPESDKEAYKQILTPSEIDEGRWVPYPRYRYVPMLMAAFHINHAYCQKEKIARKLKMANQNLKDALALREATYYMERE